MGDFRDVLSMVAEDGECFDEAVNTCLLRFGQLGQLFKLLHSDPFRLGQAQPRFDWLAVPNEYTQRAKIGHVD
jgi:hypothetical protein